MKMKRILVLLVCFCLLIPFTAQARDMNVYVNNQYLVRDVQNIGGFDMLPVLDIAGELGFTASFDGTTAVLSSPNYRYTFTLGSPDVYDKEGRWYGLDIVPQMINGKFMIPAKFFQDAMGKSYFWDSVTDSVFLDSDAEYKWLISTPEYQQAKNAPKTKATTPYEKLKNFMLEKGEYSDGDYYYILYPFEDMTYGIVYEPSEERICFLLSMEVNGGEADETLFLFETQKPMIVFQHSKNGALMTQVMKFPYANRTYEVVLSDVPYAAKESVTKITNIFLKMANDDLVDIIGVGLKELGIYFEE